MNLPELIGRAGRWIVLAVVFLLAAELTARIEDHLTWGAPLWSSYSETSLTVRDSLGNHGRANYRYQKWRMNNLGFRGPDITPEPAPGRTRVAILGASETFGLYETEGQEYAAVMQRLLDSLAPGRYEIVNVGLPGLSLSSMVPYYRAFVEPLRPRYVFVYPSPSFYLEVNPLPPVYVLPKNARPSPPPPAFESRLPHKARESLKTMIPGSFVAWYRERKLLRRRAAEPADWVWRDVPAERMELMRLHLRALVDSIQIGGVQAVLVTHTNRFLGAPADTLSPDRRRLTDLESLYYPRASMTTMVALDSVANQMMREVAREKGAAVIEVEKRIPSASAYFADYAHFTDRGAEAMARLLTDGLLRLETAPSGPAAMQP